MKKISIVFALALFVASMSIFTLSSVASAQSAPESITDIDAIEGRGGNGGGHGGSHGKNENKNHGKGHSNHDSHWLTQAQKETLVAGVLGMTVADLQTAVSAGQTMTDTVTAQGLTVEQYQADLQTALVDEANQGVIDGTLTQVQADIIIANIAGGVYNDIVFSHHGKDHGSGDRHHGSHWLTYTEKETIVAGVLGITVVDLQVAVSAGQTMTDTVTAQGLTVEQYQADLQTALTDATNQAVTEGTLTQAQADVIIAKIAGGVYNNIVFSHHGKGHGNHGSHWLKRAQKKTIVAGVLGMTVADLETAVSAGQTMTDTVIAQGLTVEQYQADLRTALTDAANQAVVDGTLTQVEADVIIAKIASGGYDNSVFSHHHSSCTTGSGRKHRHHICTTAPVVTTPVMTTPIMTTPVTTEPETPVTTETVDDGGVNVSSVENALSQIDQQSTIRVFLPLING